jgi:hypothetical protein
MTNMKFKTGKLLLSMASAAVIFMSGLNESYAAASTSTSVTMQNNGTANPAVISSAVSTVSGTHATATAPVLATIHQRTLFIDEEAAATAIVIPTHDAAADPIKHTVYYIATVDKTDVPAITATLVRPGDIIEFFCAAGGAQTPTFTATAFGYGSGYAAENKAKYDSKVAKIIFYGPDAPTFTRVAGVDFQYVSMSIANIHARLK